MKKALNLILRVRQVNTEIKIVIINLHSSRRYSMYAVRASCNWCGFDPSQNKGILNEWRLIAVSLSFSSVVLLSY